MELRNEVSKAEINAWMQGIKYEAAFWNANLSPVKRRRNREKRVKDTTPVYLPDNLRRLQDIAIESLKDCDTIEAMDLGCGLSYLPIPFLGDKKVNVHYVDPLSGIYNRIIKKKKIDLPLIEFGMVEYLNSFYKSESMDYIIIRNALDHSFNPLQGIVSVVDVLKKGGVLQLNHAENEAEYEDYVGFHQYNITEENGHLIIWNKKDRWDVSEYMAPFCDISVERRNDGIRERIVCTMVKKNPVSELLNFSDYALILSEMMENMENLIKPFYGIGYRLSYYFLSIAHHVSVFFGVLRGK